VLLAVPTLSNASALKQETLKAWDDYLRTVNLRLNRSLSTGDPSLWIEEEARQRQRVRQGEILISPVGESGLKKVHDGLIHDWIGDVFISSARMDEVFTILHDYNRYKDFYKPTIIESRLLGRTSEEYQFSMLGLKTVLFETIVYEGQFESHCSLLDGRRRYCVSYCTRFQEIKDYGQASQHKLPIGEGHGYIWRL